MLKARDDPPFSLLRAIKVNVSAASEMGHGASLDSFCSIFVFYLFVSVTLFFVFVSLVHIIVLIF